MVVKIIVNNSPYNHNSKNDFGGFFALLLVLGIIISACSNGTTGNSDMRYSIQVNNQAGNSRAIVAGDKVELYIHHFEYQEDANNRALILIASGDRDTGSKGGILNNAGWYSVDANLAVTNDVNPGPYSSFLIGISKLRITKNGIPTEYSFPNIGEGVCFGNPSPIWYGGHSNYAENFSGITITDSVVSLKTVLTVEPGILDNDNKLVSDPFKFIKVEGRINE